LAGVVVYYAVCFVVAFFFVAVIGPPAGLLAPILGLIAWLAVFWGAFHAQWLGARRMVVVARHILLVPDFLTAAFDVKLPDFPF